MVINEESAEKSLSCCLYCHGAESNLLYCTDDVYGNAYELRLCTSCKCHYLWPFPSKQLLEQAYRNEYYGHGTDKFKSNWIERLLDYFRGKRADKLHRLLNGSGRVLDIGCGNGRFLDFIQKRGDYEIYGVEISDAAARRAKGIPDINLLIGRLNSASYSPNSFDAITLFHVIEHLEQPSETLDLIKTLLKPNGVVAFSFPNIGSLQSRLFKGNWFHMDAPRHLSFFRPKDFIKMMEGRGFRLIEERYFNVEYNPYGTLQSILNLFTSKREVFYEHLKGNKDYVSNYSRLNLILQEAFFKVGTPVFVLVDALEAMFRNSGTVELIFRKTDNTG